MCGEYGATRAYKVKNQWFFINHHLSYEFGSSREWSSVPAATIIIIVISMISIITSIIAGIIISLY